MPKIVDHQQRQHELAQAAFDTVCKLGIVGTTMRSLAETAKCSTGTLVHYFQNKDDILIAALNFANNRCGARMQTLVRLQKPFLLRQITIASLPTETKGRDEWKVWLEFWGQASHHSELKKIHRQYYVDWLGALKRAMQKGIDQKELRPSIDIETEVSALSALIDGLGIHATLDPKRMPAKRLTLIIQQHLQRLELTA